jgi:voltage-gated potassium channel Kch
MNLDRSFSGQVFNSRVWWVIFAMALLAVILGITGMRNYELENYNDVHPGNVLYHTLQMFILHTPYFEKPVNPALEIARWLAAGAFLLAVFVTLTHIFILEFRLLTLFVVKDHIIVCGLGKLGLHLALELKKAGNKVIAIENSERTDSILQAEKKGIIIILGDARDPGVLKRARVKKARQILAVCTEDATNVAIAIRAGELLKNNVPGNKQKECWLFIKNPKLRAILKCRNLFPVQENNYRVNIKGLDIPEGTARQTFDIFHLDHHPIMADSNTQVHLVIMGCGQMGEALIMQALRIGHFANEKKIKITLIDEQAEHFKDNLLSRVPAIPEFCDMETLDKFTEDNNFWDEFRKKLETMNNKDTLWSFVACYEEKSIGSDLNYSNENLNLTVGIRLAREVGNYNAQILIYLNNKQGYALLSDKTGRIKCSGLHLHTFGALEDIFTPSALMYEEQDRLAQEIHLEYLNTAKQRCLKNKLPFPNKPSQIEWENLDENYKDSNRQVADHIPVKLRALGLHIVSIKESTKRSSDFNEADILLLSRMEHNRWCCEKRLDNWTYGVPFDEKKKIHDNICPWLKLAVDIQSFDKEQVKLISSFLEKMRKGISG